MSARAHSSSADADLVTDHLHLADLVARRYAGRGEPLDDLRQVASIGLMGAAERFDPSRGVPFRAYAIATMAGEIKRHFRDAGWSVKVPRTVQSISSQVGRTIEELSQRLERTPSMKEVAEASGLALDDVVQALTSTTAYQPEPLDGEAVDPMVDNSTLESVETAVTLEPALEILSEAEQKVVVLRFFEDLSQRQIAARLGISQMHVSRLLARAMTTLREWGASVGQSGR